MQGPGKAEWPFPFSLFRNIKLFYVVFAAVMVSALIVPTLCTQNQSTPVDDSDVRVVTQTTTPSPIPTGTGTPDATVTETPSASATPTGTGTPDVTATATLSTSTTPTPTGTPDGSATPTPTPSPGPTSTPEPTASPGPKQYAKAPEMTIDTAKKYFATMKTARGDIRIELDAIAAPKTVNSFVFLAREGFYDGVTFHRVLPGFVAQAGAPTGTGGGGPGYTIPDEQNDLKHDVGVIAMAKPSDPQTVQPLPDSAGSQFYITLAPEHHLDGLYTVFGHVVEGMDVLKALTPRDPSSGAELPPGDVIVSITIEEQ